MPLDRNCENACFAASRSSPTSHRRNKPSPSDSSLTFCRSSIYSNAHQEPQALASVPSSSPTATGLIFQRILSRSQHQPSINNLRGPVAWPLTSFHEGRLSSKRLVPTVGSVDPADSWPDESADDNVGHNIARPRFQICPLGRIGLIFFSSEFANEQGLFTVLVPQEAIICSQKIAVIFQQLFQAGTGNIHQFDFHFFGSS